MSWVKSRLRPASACIKMLKGAPYPPRVLISWQAPIARTLQTLLPMCTQALSSGLHCLPDSQLLLQQLQEGRGWQLLLSACEAKGTQRTSQRAWQSGAAAAREAGGCGCSCSCALAALSAALQLALAGGRGLTPNSNAGHCGDQQQQVQVQEQEQQGGEPEGCRVRAPWLPPPFVLPRLVSMSSTNLAAAHCTGSSSNGSSDSSSDMSLATGKHKIYASYRARRTCAVLHTVSARHVQIIQSYTVGQSRVVAFAATGPCVRCHVYGNMPMYGNVTVLILPAVQVCWSCCCGRHIYHVVVSGCCLVTP